MPVTWLGKTYTVKYVNARCVIGPPIEDSTLVERKYEVCVSGIPPNFGPDELVPIFSFAGDIHEVRLLMNFNMTNRGMAFVQYKNSSSVKKAFKLHNMEILQGYRLRVRKSFDVRTVSLRALDVTANVDPIIKMAADVAQLPIVKTFYFNRYQKLNVDLTFATNDDAILALRRLSHCSYFFGPNCRIFMKRVNERSFQYDWGFQYQNMRVF